MRKIIKKTKKVLLDNWIVLSMLFGMSVLYYIMFTLVSAAIFFILMSTMLVTLTEITKKYNNKYR